MVVGFGSLLIQGVSANRQAKTTLQVSEASARAAFQLKTAELLISSKHTQAAKERAEALQSLFPDQINDKFVKAFDNEQTFKLPSIDYQERRLELFKILAQNLDKKDDIFLLYSMLYADDGNTVRQFRSHWLALYPEARDKTKKFFDAWDTYEKTVDREKKDRAKRKEEMRKAKQTILATENADQRIT